LVSACLFAAVTAAPSADRPDTRPVQRPGTDLLAGQITEISGRVAFGSTAIDTDQRIVAGRTLDADDGASFLFVANGRNAVVRVIGPARLRTGRRGQVTLERGRALTAVRPGTRFQLSTPGLVAGVRGTVFYTETDSDGSYLCLCTGSVAVTVPGDSRLISATHHEACRVRPGGRLESAPMLGHTDTDVERILLDLR
jgi:hypothetical protein